MSGPKDHDIVLEQRRRAKLERLRQERLRKIREETDRLNNQITKSKTQFDSIDKHLSSLIVLAEKSEEMSNTHSRLCKIRQSHKEKIIKALEINVPIEPEDISKRTNNLMQITQNIVNDYYTGIKILEDRIIENEKLIKDQKERDELSKKLAAGTGKIGEIQDFNFTAAINKIENSNIEKSVEEKARQLLLEIEELINSESIQESEMQTVLQIANNIYVTAFESEKGFKTAEIQYNIIKPDVIKNIEIFDDLYNDYYAEYVIFLDLINKSTSVPNSITPKEKYEFESICDLEQEIANLTNESKMLTEKIYIREQIDEVMKEYGYNVSKEIVFGEDHEGSHFICRQESGDTGIHIYMSGDKQIMMEIVGVDARSEDANYGIMVASSDLDETEKNRLLDEQGSFCELHPKILEELAERGVVFNMNSKKEPNLRYSKRIVITDTFVDSAAVKSELINKGNVRPDRAKNKKAQLRALKI